MKASRLFRPSLWLVFLFGLSSAETGFAQERSVLGRAEPLVTVLNPDGTLNLTTGFSGSLDTRGWKMVTGSGGEPRFVLPGETMASSASVGAQLVPEDENWDDRFQLPSVDGRVLAIAISGSDVYVGGQFTTAGVSVSRGTAPLNLTHPVC